MARPKKVIDVRALEELASLHCTIAEMAAVLGVSSDTLERRFRDVMAAGKERGREKLRRAQWKAAMKGNTAMLIWLGKNMLDQRDKQSQEISGPGGKPIETSTAGAPEMTDEQVQARISELLSKGKASS